jgi:transposase
MLRVFGELDHQPLEVAFEATFGWGWFADLLADAGIPAHMAHPLVTKAICSARVKNDSVDAKTLAHLLAAHRVGQPLELGFGERTGRGRIGEASPQLACRSDPRSCFPTL